MLIMLKTYAYFRHIMLFNLNTRAVSIYQLLVYRPILHLLGISRYCFKFFTDTNIYKKEKEWGIGKAWILNTKDFLTFEVYRNLIFDLQLLEVTEHFFTFLELLTLNICDHAIIIHASLMHILSYFIYIGISIGRYEMSSYCYQPIYMLFSTLKQLYWISQVCLWKTTEYCKHKTMDHCPWCLSHISSTCLLSWAIRLEREREIETKHTRLV